MSRVVLIHWAFDTASSRADRLREAGYEVTIFPGAGDASPATLWREPAAAFVVDLERLPSQGRDLAVILRQRASTREIPLLFCGGEPDKVARVREALPDAVYSDWRRIAGDLALAIDRPPVRPLVPAPMAGYSATPLPKKLGLKADSLVALLGAPEGFEALLEPLPEGLRVRHMARGTARTVLLFAPWRKDLARRFPGAQRTLAEGGGLWILWPKKASGVATDLDQAAVRAFGLAAGFVDYKVCAVDKTWSGLLFARRKE